MDDADIGWNGAMIGAGIANSEEDAKQEIDEFIITSQDEELKHLRNQVEKLQAEKKELQKTLKFYKDSLRREKE